MAAYFEEGMPLVKAPKDLANFLIVEINGYLNKEVKTIAELPLKPATLAEIVLLQETGGLSHKQCADILAKVLSNPTLTPKGQGRTPYRRSGFRFGRDHGLHQCGFIRQSAVDCRLQSWQRPGFGLLGGSSDESLPWQGQSGRGVALTQRRAR
jgi:hypothetical protein